MSAEICLGENAHRNFLSPKTFSQISQMLAKKFPGESFLPKQFQLHMMLPIIATFSLFPTHYTKIIKTREKLDVCKIQANDFKQEDI